LAREPDLAVHTRSRLVEIAREKGFPVEELILVDHSAPVCARVG
jgi:lipocalin